MSFRGRGGGRGGKFIGVFIMEIVKMVYVLAIMHQDYQAYV